MMYTLLLFCSLAFTYIGQQGSFSLPTVYQSNVKITFTIINAGINVDGTMEVNHCEVKFFPDDLPKSFIKGTIDPSSIQTGIAIRDKHLRQSDYFDVKNYPVIYFSSTEFRKKGNRKYECDFELIIKKEKKSIPVTFSRTRKGDKLIYKGNFSLSRLDFGLGEKSVILSEIVNVQVEMETSASPI